MRCWLACRGCRRTETSCARPKGMLDVLPPESARWIELVARFATRAERFGYGLLLTPIVEHYEVFAARRRDHRRRAQGDVRLRRPRRPPARAAARRHRAGRARVRAAPAADAVEGLVPRAELPRRAAAGRPLPPALAARRRGASGSTIPTSTSRSSSCSCRLLPRPRAARRAAARQLDGRRREPRRATARCCSTYWRAHADAARRRDGARRGEPVAHPRLEAARLAGHARARAAARRVPHRRVGRALRARAGGLAGARHPVRDRAPARARLRLLHEHRVRVRRAARSTPRRTRSAAAAATTGSPRRWAGPPRRRSASARASSACCSRAMPKACCPCPRRAVDVFVVDLVGDRPTRRGLLAELRESGLAADRAYGGRSLKKQMAAADESGARVGRHPRRRRGRAGRGRGEGHARPATQIEVRARRDRGVAADEEGRRHRHDAHRIEPATCAPTTSASRSRCAAGSRTGATTAARCSSTCATSRASCRSSSTRALPGLDVAHRLRSEWVVRVVGDVVGAARREP